MADLRIASEPAPAVARRCQPCWTGRTAMAAANSLAADASRYSLPEDDSVSLSAAKGSNARTLAANAGGPAARRLAGQGQLQAWTPGDFSPMSPLR